MISAPLLCHDLHPLEKISPLQPRPAHNHSINAPRNEHLQFYNQRSLTASLSFSTDFVLLFFFFPPLLLSSFFYSSLPSPPLTDSHHLRRFEKYRSLPFSPSQLFPSPRFQSRKPTTKPTKKEKKNFTPLLLSYPLDSSSGPCIAL